MYCTDCGKEVKKDVFDANVITVESFMDHIEKSLQLAEKAIKEIKQIIKEPMAEVTGYKETSKVLQKYISQNKGMISTLNRQGYH